MDRTTSSNSGNTAIDRLDLHANSGRRWPSDRLAVRAFVALTVVFGLLGVFGAAVGNARLAGFGNPDQPVQPLAALSYIAIAAALCAPLNRRPWASLALLAIPTFVVCAATFETVIGATLGGDRRLLLPAIGAADGRYFGRPYVQTLAILTMLGVAVGIARWRGRSFSAAVAALACVALGVSLLSAIIVLFQIAPAGGAQFFLPSLPAAAQAIAISAAVLAWGGWPKFDEIPGRGPQHGKILQRAFPAVVLIPAISALAEIVIGETGAIPPLVVDVIVAGINIAVFAGILFWSDTRIAAEHAMVWETANALESAPIALTSAAGTIRHWSRGCEELYGWTAAEAVGRVKYDLLRSRHADPARPLPEPGENQQRELIEQRRDGKSIHVIEQGRLVQAEGRTAVMVYTMTDITERVRIEAALAEIDANLSLALNAQQIGTFDWNRITGAVVVSAGLEQRFGLQPGDLSTTTAWTARIEPDDMAAMLTTIVEAAGRHAERWRYQYRIMVPNGGMRAIEGTGRLIYDTTGELCQIVGVNIDVTDRNQREAALLAEQEQLRLVLKTDPSAMIIFDHLNIIKAFSASAEQLFGYAAHEVIGRDVEMLAASPEIHRANSFVSRYLEGGTSYVTYDTQVIYARRRDGSLVPIELWIGDTGVGSKRLFTAFVRDLTERLRSEKREAEMRAELLHASRLSAIGEMAAGLAHELNQPLAAAAYFLGAADLVLAEEADREQGRALLRLGMEQALRAGEIIRRMRDFATRETIDMQVGPILAIIEDAVSLAFLGGTEDDIKFVYDLDPLAEMVLADRVQIVQVFVNLLRNATEALRHCPPAGRRITIRTKALGDEMVEVSVADTGPGLDLSIIDLLYMPFVSTKREQGMGVGLSICRRIIEWHGGTFRAANSASGGGVICFTLPNPYLTSEIDE